MNPVSNEGEPNETKEQATKITTKAYDNPAYEKPVTTERVLGTVKWFNVKKRFDCTTCRETC